MSIQPALAGETPILAPDKLGVSADHLARIDALVAAEIAAGNMPGCVVAVGRSGGLGFLQAYGRRQIEPVEEAMTVDTAFDLASLTKPIATATSVMILVERGQLRLRAPVADYIPEFGQNGKQQITLEQLLVHHSGLVPDNPLADYEHGAERAWERIFALEPQQPPGTKFVYSDVNFLVLGEVVHRITGDSLAEFASSNIFQPLGMASTTFLPGDDLARQAAPTEKRDGQWLRGEVHDPRSALLGGIAGHAGLFSTAGDLAVYAQTLLRGARPGHEPPRIMSRATLAEMVRARALGDDFRGLGWDLRSRFSSNRGELLSSSAFGHGGFTGTSLWIDPELDLFVIFLSNRLHPDGAGSVNPLAGTIGTIAAASLAQPSPEVVDSAARRVAREPAVAVLNGVDVLEQQDFALLKGQRVGVITNHTGVNRRGERTIDLLNAAKDVDLVAVFSPEHGIAGILDEEGIGDARDEATSTPIFSLYGDSRRPSPDQLKNVDVLVFDIQDVGARFYTYMTTMAWAMEEAARHNKRFVVLDRPNPINGRDVSGPLLDAGRESFVGFHTLPVRHGMTAGELAKMYRAERRLDLELTVVPVAHWRRGMYFDATGLPWINPSPNMRRLTAAVLYPGLGLLEMTNISVGRGTDTPFEVIGAPWIDGRQLAQALNAAGLEGIGFVPMEFTPTASKFAGETCGGVSLVVTHRDAAEPVSVGLEIACALRRLYRDDWDMEGLDRLLCNRAVLESIRLGNGRSAVSQLIQPTIDAFRQRRREFLLYPE
jgi:uncharacterized protein YbbC (DUF1343 family)/CubicO group peptidase (beta-lactamase class C family)